ncbi:hypothetical protein V6N13_140475 [Hibiscus sabdariffa]|uniref:Uncharacterized protein n=1 Tax=Hibiscus sabdariffa TaxID=183260 RepID=A0ABR2Q9Y7_9ROSI
MACLSSDQLMALQPYLLTVYSDKTADHAWLFGRQLNKEPDRINCDASQQLKQGTLTSMPIGRLQKLRMLKHKITELMESARLNNTGRELLLSKTSRRQLNEREERGGKGDLGADYRNGTLLLRTPFIAIQGTRYLFLVIRMQEV